MYLYIAYPILVTAYLAQIFQIGNRTNLRSGAAPVHKYGNVLLGSIPGMVTICIQQYGNVCMVTVCILVLVTVTHTMYVHSNVLYNIIIIINNKFNLSSLLVTVWILFPEQRTLPKKGPVSFLIDGNRTPLPPFLNEKILSTSAELIYIEKACFSYA